ncbi:MAG TPA: ATP-binding cassette domain-containing protein [Planctomycetota bacterium]|nr:ATP-binding cassette domain-containing protein [Planctomycetota bacterium]
MSASAAEAPVLLAKDVRKTFKRGTGELVNALDGVSLETRRGALTALVGPDGSGKTTLMRLTAGLLDPDAGKLTVLGLDSVVDADRIQSRVAYMPQQFGLYEDLTCQENLDLYADLHGVPLDVRRERYARLMEMTGLGRFTGRLAGRLSGGMKQKLGLACTLVRVPELLLLDEPTVGVDPVSRQELWAIVSRLVREGLTVLVATSYLDEAERCESVLVLHQGKVLARGRPQDVSAVAADRVFRVAPPVGMTAHGFQARLLDDPHILDAVPEAGRVRVVLDEPRPGSLTVEVASCEGTPAPVRFEDGFMVYLRRAVGQAATTLRVLAKPPEMQTQREVVVRTHDLVRMFGTFTAVDHVGFEVRRGEIFGLLGPNGAGKTTTFRMLCGLLPATSGELRVAGVDLHTARASARQKIGYVAQKFSLYGQLSVSENLDFFASAYGLTGTRRRERIRWALDEYELAGLARLPTAQLPGGFKQRLAMAAALMHEPEILFLDEPTSGADPLARREFWRRINALSEQGVSVIVTTHFMEEAEFCDRILIQDQGRKLAEGTPAEVRALAGAPPGREPTMEDAFLAIVARARSTPRENAA